MLILSDFKKYSFLPLKLMLQNKKKPFEQGVFAKIKSDKS